MEGCGAKTVLLSLTGQSRASAVVNLDGLVFFGGGRGVVRPQVLQVLKGCGEVECERCPEGWQMSPS